EERKKRDRKEETFPNLLRPRRVASLMGETIYPTLILFIPSARWFGRRPKQSKESSEMDIYILGNRTPLGFFGSPVSHDESALDEYKYLTRESEVCARCTQHDLADFFRKVLNG
ncbi:hypothetical protein TNIN_477681, partial [Trichonephila inaurata madagascariensis]